METGWLASDFSWLRQMGALGERAIAALERMASRECTAGEVATIAAEVVLAARRYLRGIGSEHEGAAAAELLAMIVISARKESLSAGDVDSLADSVAKYLYAKVVESAGCKPGQRSKTSATRA